MNYRIIKGRRIMMVLLLFCFMTSEAQLPDFSKYPVYEGNDLGLTYTKSASSFRIWSPTAEVVELRLYSKGEGGDVLQRIQMIKGGQGTWTASINRDLAGKFYTFRIMVNGKWNNEVPDPYAKSVGVNGRRAMVVDLARTNPEGWNKDKTTPMTSKTNAVIYELHVRDASISPGSGIKHKGKYLGLTEKGTRNSDGMSTGLDHLIEMGVTHIHLLPCFDFYSVDESTPDKAQYNWGYDPLNYNVPEGSYATNAEDGITRIKEFKQLIKTFHDNGLKVIMDVVYNHTRLTEDSWFNQLVPGYYYRHDAKGAFSNATACNNETASERPMFRKFMLESVKYWVEEYHVDGFRFDLMGVHDIETMNLISKQLHELKPDILLYGEGWTAGPSPLPEEKRAVKKNAHLLKDIAVFSDDIRDGIKGSVFEFEDKGFASGKSGMEESIKFGVVGAMQHPQVKYSKVNYSKAAYAGYPWNVISYCECHDNHVLADKLMISARTNSNLERREMQKLALGIVLTSQGISFLHAGTEFLRSKNGVENSFESGDSINRINWELKARNRDVFEFVKGMIAMRKAHPAFRMTDANLVRKGIKFLQDRNNFVSYTIDGNAAGDSWKNIFVLYNGNAESREFKFPPGKWKVHVQNNKIVKSTEPVPKLDPWSVSVFYQE